MSQVAEEYRRVNLSSDPLYGYIQVTKLGSVPGEAAEQNLIDSVWLQRLRRIHQLQTAWWVYATAEHSRFQHALGAMHLAGEWAHHLYPTLRRQHPDLPSQALVVETLRLAGLLHDAGHGPFGHFFDDHYLNRWAIDHEDVGRHLIRHELAPLIAGLRASPEADFEAGESIDPRWVSYLISPRDLEGFSPPRWLGDLKPVIGGPFSADNMDYVPRDAYVCGVAVGPVDVRRIIHYSFISERGLCLHIHGSEAVFMFLSARLYLYNQVYFHRTVRRIDLQLREVFGPTMDLLLGGNPIQSLDRFERLDEWHLLVEAGRWARGEMGPAHRDLGQAWMDITARRLKWRLVYSAYAEAREAPSGILTQSKTALAGRIRDQLSSRLRALEFEVDIAAQKSNGFNPLAEAQDILFYDPLDKSYRRSQVLDLFRRLPLRMALFRVFARGDEGLLELATAARGVLGGE